MAIKKALLLGTSFSAIPLFNALSNRPLDLSICGNLPSDPCHDYTEQSFNINYANKGDLLELVKEQQFQYLIPSCNDYSYLSGAWVANTLGLTGFDSYETTLTLHDKHLFRRFTQKQGYPVPKAIYLKKGQNIDTSDISFPILIKPVDSFSGRGVTKITDPSLIQTAIEHALSASTSDTVVLEEFVEGNLHSHSCFIKDGAIAFEVIADEFCSVYPYQVNCSNIPSCLSKQQQHDISECIQSLITELNLVDGLLHTQFIMNEGRFWIIECMRRAPGDLYGKMVELAQGVNYSDLYIRPFIEEDICLSVNTSSQKYIARHTLSVNKPKAFEGVNYHLPSSLSNILSIPLKNSGHHLEEAPFDKAGIIFAEAQDMTTLFELTPRLADMFTL